jgi:hypothetical protein
MLRGRIVAESSDSVTVATTLAGRVTLPRAVVSGITDPEAAGKSALATVPTLGNDESRRRRVQWSPRIEIGVQHISEVVRKEVGAVFGGSFGMSLERSTPRTSMSVSIQTNYQRQSPNPAAADDNLLTMTAARSIRPKVRVVGQTFIERNRPQEIEIRYTQHLGIGRQLVKSERMTLFLAPGVTYAYANASEEAELAASGTVTASGFGGGFYESLALRLAPALSLTQNLLWTEIRGRRQYASTLTLSGRLSAHVAMNLVHNLRFDSGLVDPVRKTLGRTTVGLQFAR